jgi:hypothetical protein
VRGLNHFRAFAGQFGRRVAYAALSRPLFRLCLGRWPDDKEQNQFTQALCARGSDTPALLRALYSIPAGRARIGRLAMAALIDDGLLAWPPLASLEPLAGNPFAFWTGPPASLLHIEKTAGTALGQALCAHCHPMQIYTDSNLGETQRLGAPAAPPPADLADRKLIWGHYDLPGLLRLAPGRRVVTLLREPRARVLSLYYFWRSIRPGRAEALADPRVRLAHELDLLDFLRCRQSAVHDSIDNAYVRRLASLNAGDMLEDKVASDPAGALSLAMAALDDLAFIGIVERIPESLAGLSKVLGVRLGGSLPKTNVGAHNAASNPEAFRPVEREAVTPEIEAELRKRTYLDQIIYDACCARLDAHGQTHAY